jgi:hypothetical protein
MREATPDRAREEVARAAAEVGGATAPPAAPVVVVVDALARVREVRVRRVWAACVA